MLWWFKILSESVGDNPHNPPLKFILFCELTSVWETRKQSLAGQHLLSRKEN